MQRLNARRSISMVGALLAVLILSSCRTDWSTWGFGTGRLGYNPAEQTIGPSNVAKLQQQWASFDLGARINTTPIVATGINVQGTPTDVVYVGTEHGVLFAFSTAGQILWFRGTGTQTTTCLDQPDGIYGITGAPVFDRATNRVYAAASDGKIHAFNAATGADVPGWPVTYSTIPQWEFASSALSLRGNNLYAAIASHCDRGPYYGGVIRIDTTTRATNKFYVSGSPSGPRGGGIWGWGGASVDPADGDVYVATGNVFANPENSFYGDAIVRLGSTLNVKASHSPGFGIVDDDFGSTPVLFQKNGCPPQLVAEQKNGALYLYDRNSIAGGYRQKVVVSTSGFIGVPAYSPVTQLLYVVNPKPQGFFVEGLLAFRLDASCRLQLAWQSGSPVSLGSTPTIANGVAYYTDGFATKIHAVNASTGQHLWASGPEVTGGVLAAPVVVNGQLFVGAYDRKLHAYGLP